MGLLFSKVLPALLSPTCPPHGHGEGEEELSEGDVAGVIRVKEAGDILRHNVAVGPRVRILRVDQTMATTFMDLQIFIYDSGCNIIY
jgi:hypothetical protein